MMAFRIKQLILLTGDLALMYAGLWGGLGLRTLSIPSADLWGRHVPIFTLTFLCWVVINYINGLYDATRTYPIRRFAETGIMALMTGVIFFYLFGEAGFSPKTILLIAATLTYIGIGFWHIQFGKAQGNIRLQTKIAFAGLTEEAVGLISILQKEPERGYRIEAIFDADPKDFPTLASSTSLPFYKKEKMKEIFTEKGISTVILVPLNQNAEVMPALYPVLFSDVSVKTLSDFYEEITGRIPHSLFSEESFLSNLKRERNPLYRHIRRTVDLLAVLLIGSVFLILFPFIAILIKVSSPGPLFFKQKRTGEYGQIFWMHKLRSMYALSPDGSAELHGFEFAKKEDKRVTPIGKWLRRMRIDELPQLWNLVRGDITLIGPRPERPEIVAELEARMPYYALRNMVKPGLTGWAVLHQDYTDTIERSLEKLQYDLYYIKNRSLLLDMAILLKTIDKIIRMKGQ